jgi:hypothetical protein
MSQAATVIDLDSIRRQRRAAKPAQATAAAVTLPAPVLYPVWVMWMPVSFWPALR